MSLLVGLVVQDADDRERMLVEFDGRADDSGISMKRAAPERIAQDDAGR